MSNPGWYPDPSGQPNRFRYWDGSSWGQDTTDNPYQPSGPANPYGQGGPGSPGGGGRRTGLIVGGAVLAVLLVVGGIVGAVALTGDDSGDDVADDPTTSESASQEPDEEASGDPTAEPTDESSEAPGGSTGPECTAGNPTDRTTKPGDDGRIRGGGLSFDPPYRYEAFQDLASVFTFAHDMGIAYREVERGWVSLLAVGELLTEDGFTDPESAAAAVTACMIGSENFYTGITSTTTLRDEAVTVAGKDAWSVRTEILVDVPELSVKGDITDVTVVDLGDPGSYAVFVGVVTVGKERLLERMESAISGLQAE